MKKIVASVGLVALGASGLRADSTLSAGAESPKPWSISATLRGFYDDNINSAPSGPIFDAAGNSYHRGSFGFEISPSAIFSWAPTEDTSLNAGYVYAFKYYENKPRGNTDNYDQNHTFNISLNHAFNEQYKLDVRDSFVVGQEPDFLRTGNAFTTFARVSGNNIRNYGAFNFDGTLTPIVGFELGYANSLYDYSANSIIPASSPLGFQPSVAGILNRLEHVVHLDSRWQLQPATVGVVGYQFSEVDFTGNQPILDPTAFPGVNSDTRNSTSHYGYVGVDQTFRPDLTGSVRAGVRYTDYPNENVGSTSDVEPYVQLSLRWMYAMESYVEGGFTHDRSATDLFNPNAAGQVTLDADSSIVYATVNHRLASNLYGSVTAQFQDSVYNGGAYNSQAEQYYTVGLNLQYRFSPFVSTEVGYNYDNLESGIVGRQFDRNRVYLGITATY